MLNAFTLTVRLARSFAEFVGFSTFYHRRRARHAGKKQ